MGILLHKSIVNSKLVFRGTLVLALMVTPLFGEIPLFEEGTIMAKFKPGLDQKQFSENLRDIHLNQSHAKIDVIEILPAFHIPTEKSSSLAEGLRRIYSIKYVSDLPADRVAKTVSRLPLVEYAEPKYFHSLHDTPNDPFFSGQSQYNYIHAPEAWDIVKGDSGDVIVAVIDGGTEWTHVDLIENVWTNPNEIPGDGIDNDANGFVDDIHGWNFTNNTNDPTGLPEQGWSASHGTKVAGIVGAGTNNSRGVASLAWNVQMMPMCASNAAFDGAISWGYESMLYAAHNGARILTNSWGRRGDYSQLEQEIIDYLNSLDCVILSSSNNLNTNNDHEHLYPANYRHVMAVGATEQISLQRASFSGYGGSVDVFAPGVNWAVTQPGNNYSSGGHTGTSYATPFTASLAALVMTQNPDWTGKMVAEQVRVTADRMDAANPSYLNGLLGHGRINALRALTETDNPALRVSGSRFQDCPDGDCFLPGDTLTIIVEYTNYLAPVTNVEVSLSVDYDHLSFIDNSGTIPSLGSQESIELSFDLTLSETASFGDWVPFYSDLDNGADYQDRDYFAKQVDPLHLRNMNTGVIQTTITTEGNIGWTDFEGSDGQGFVFEGSNILNELGLVIGRGPDQVSDCIRGPVDGLQEQDFRAISPLDQDEAVPFFAQEYYFSMDDLNADLPTGLIVEQVVSGESEAYPILDNGMLVIYNIYNPTDSILHNLHLGLFSDWNLNGDQQDIVGYDASRNLGYMQNAQQNASKYAGVQILTDSDDISFKSYNNTVDFQNGFTDEDKWAGLSGGVQSTTSDASDWSFMISIGGIDLMPHDFRRIGFTVFAANSQSDLNNYADFVGGLWSSVYPYSYLSTEELEMPSTFKLAQNFPNPFNPSTKINYSLENDSQIELGIYDLKGRKITEIHSGLQVSGQHAMEWNGVDDLGNAVPAGVYICSLQLENSARTIKMVYLK